MDNTPDTGAEKQAFDQALRDFSAGCEARSGAELPFLSTQDVARDVDILRDALGDESLRYLGLSYGTFIGTVYADLFPDKVGRLVLDAALDPTLDELGIAVGQADGFEAELTAFATDCMSRPDCPLTGTAQDAVAQIGRFLRSLDAEPIEVGDRELTESLARTAIGSTLYNAASGWPALRRALASAFSGSGATLLTYADSINGRKAGAGTDNSYEARIAVICIDFGEPPSAADVAARTSGLAAKDPIFGPPLPYAALPCGYWPVAPRIAPHEVHAAGAAPILVIGTTGDPATPYAWSQALASELDDAALLTRDDHGHTAYRRTSLCIDDAVDAYLLNGTLPPDGTIC